MKSTVPLSEFALFRNLPPDLITQIRALCTEESYTQGDFVFREGHQASKLHFLLSGSVSLKVKLTSKPESITVSVVKQMYESFGWSGIVPPHQYTASAMCEQDTSVLTLPGDGFLELLNENPAAGFMVMQRVAEIIANRLKNSRQALLKTL